MPSLEAALAKATQTGVERSLIDAETEKYRLEEQRKADEQRRKRLEIAAIGQQQMEDRKSRRRKEEEELRKWDTEQIQLQQKAEN